MIELNQVLKIIITGIPISGRCLDSDPVVRVENFISQKCLFRVVQYVTIFLQFCFNPVFSVQVRAPEIPRKRSENATLRCQSGDHRKGKREREGNNKPNVYNMENRHGRFSICIQHFSIRYEFKPELSQPREEKKATGEGENVKLNERVCG